MTIITPGARYHSSHNYNTPQIKENYNIFKNNNIFITTANTFQKAHEYEINITENYLYRLSWFCIWNSKDEEEKNIDIRILLNSSQEIEYEKINKILTGSILTNLPIGINYFEIQIKSNIENNEVKIISSRVEINKIFN